MLDFLKNLFNRSDFMPHGHCYFWQPGVLWTNVIGNAIIVLAYFSIPFLLLYFVRKRKDLEYRWLFAMFAAFITFCGMTHLVDIVTVWYPAYRFEGLLKLSTGLVSVATAIALIPVVPDALKLPSPAALRDSNQKLKAEIEQRKEIENKLGHRTAQLERSNDYLKKFAYATSHDLKEPLRGIILYSQLIQKNHGGKLDDDATHKLGVVVSEAKRMIGMVESVLDLSRSDANVVEFQTVSLNDCFKVAMHSMSERLTSLQVDVKAEELPTVNGNAEQLRKVFEHLLSNSIKFRKENEHLRIEVNAEQENDQYIISFRDNGIGFDEKYSERIFQMFQHLHSKDVYEGSGIGLAICRRIIDNHGGRIWASSEEGKGTTIYFSLPVDGKDDLSLDDLASILQPPAP